MSRPLSGVKAAILVANGFCQDDMIAAQRALIEAGATVKVVSPENGLVNGWDGKSWGHNFAVEASLGTALGADYAVLVVPGGKRGHDKLNTTAHTKRFVSSFLNAGKPMFLMGDAVNLLALTGNASGRTVRGAEECRDALEQAGATWGADDFCIDGALMSADADKDNRADFIAAFMDRLTDDSAVEEAA